MTKPYHLYVVEDDPALREMLCAYLEKQGLAVTAMSQAEDMLRRIHRLRPDLIVLDVTLPGMSGLQACQRLRAEGDTVPVILLTARIEEVDRVLGLEMGADDYLGKPFSARELLARIHAVLRRTSVLPGAPQAHLPDVTIGDYRFAPATRSLEHRGTGALRVLGSVEYALLAELVAHPGVPISRERLLSASHARGDDVLPRTVDVTVMRLRRIVEPDPAVPRHLQTVRGHGYMFVPGAPMATAPAAAHAGAVAEAR
jgi:two-component system phosphate regulon response regulator OmpR